MTSTKQPAGLDLFFSSFSNLAPVVESKPTPVQEPARDKDAFFAAFSNILPAPAAPIEAVAVPELPPVHVQYASAMLPGSQLSMAGDFEAMADKIEAMEKIILEEDAGTVQQITTSPLNRENCYAFLTAGNAIFRIVSPSGAQKVYRVKLSDKSSNFYVQYLESAAPNSKYKYVGKFDPYNWMLTRTKRSQFAGSDPECQAFVAALKVMQGTKQLAPGWTIEHVGLCGKCNMALTHAGDTQRGIGSHCHG